MILTLEVFFTVAAWRKGWRWRALLPLCLSVFGGFILGAAARSSGGSIEDLLIPALFLDLVCLGVLILMSKRAPQKGSEVEYPYLTVLSDLSDSNGSDKGEAILEVDQYARNHRY